MGITYKPMKGFPNVNIPVLHRVVYAYTIDRVKAYYQISYKDYLVNAWLEENCRSPYYHSPGYLTEKFIEFEDDKEAVLFALRWT